MCRAGRARGCRTRIPIRLADVLLCGVLGVEQVEDLETEIEEPSRQACIELEEVDARRHRAMIMRLGGVPAGAAAHFR